MVAKRDVKLGMKRGVLRRCPNCGEGRLFDGYLKVRPTCERCGNANAIYRADDAAPYFTILLVGHIVVAPMLTLGVLGTWSLALLMGVMLPLMLGITLALLPFVKGAVLGFLWSLNQEAPARASAADKVS